MTNVSTVSRAEVEAIGNAGIAAIERATGLSQTWSAGVQARKGGSEAATRLLHRHAPVAEPRQHDRPTLLPQIPLLNMIDHSESFGRCRHARARIEDGGIA